MESTPNVSKSTKPKPTTRSKRVDPLPPCQVCNGTARGLHYGVTTCNACKTFFHRSLPEDIRAQYTCLKKNNQCQILDGAGKICKACRFKKCLQVGLSKRAIKKGRYNTNRKTYFILEAKKAEKDKMVCTDTTRLSGNDFKRKTRDAIKFHRTEHKGVKTNCHSTTLNQPDITQTATTTNSKMMCCPYFTETSCTNNISFQSSCSSTDSQSSGSQFHFNLQSPISLNSKSNSMIESPQSDYLSPLNNLPFAEESTRPSCSGFVIHTPLDPVYGLNEYVNDITRTQSMILQLSTSNMEIGLSNNELVNSPNSIVDSITQNQRDRVAQLYSDKKAIMKALLEAHDTDLREEFKPPEDPRTEARRFYETCRLQIEVFGSLSWLRPEEYDRIFLETGLDVDGRLPKIAEIINDEEKGMDRMIKFAEAIPGFSDLRLEDQYKLVRYGRQEFSFLLNYKYTHLGCILDNNRKWYCTLSETDANISRFFLDLSNHCHRLQALELSKEELVLLKAMSAMTPDRREPLRSPFVHHIYDHLAEMLVSCLGERRKHPHMVFAKLIDILIHNRLLEQEAIKLLRDYRIFKYMDFKETPLLKYIFKDYDYSVSDSE